MPGVWQGVHTAIVTPFRDTASSSSVVDEPAFRALVARQIRGGVQGVVVAGTTGESPTVDAHEREVLLRIALEEAGGGMPITMGVGTNDTRSTVANTERARELGAAAGLLVLPYYNKPTPEGLRAHVRATAAVGLPLVVYHVPGRTAQRLSPELLASLCDIDNVVACKEATGDIQFGQDLMLLTKKPVLSGDDFTWLPLLSVGGTGVISVVSNIAPAATVAVWKAWKAREVLDAAARHRRLYPLIRWLFSQTSPVPCKAALASLGLCAPDCRLPLSTGQAPPPELLAGLT
ncbi:MAG: 4-hydroxy-tetrahydrodipicolinate synthase [Pseudomonadota bacterium]|nr:4-hydroxy-tetrahydrodipicolinate synthase [Pseudomonadota bacterium]